MASKTELKRLQNRKARLIKQNDLYRRELQGEAGHLREGAEWIDRGYSFYKVASRLKISLLSPFRSTKKQSGIAKLWSGCTLGFRLWKNIQHR